MPRQHFVPLLKPICQRLLCVTPDKDSSASSHIYCATTNIKKLVWITIHLTHTYMIKILSKNSKYIGETK